MAIRILLALVGLFGPWLRAEEPVPIPSDAELRRLVKTEIKGQPDYYRRNVRRVGNRTIELESVLSMPADPKFSPAIFSDFPSYDRWVIPGINERPSGGSFLVQFLDFTVPKGFADRLVLGFKVDLPFLRERRERTFLVHTERAGDVFTLRGETVKAADNVIAGGAAVMKVFPAESDPTQSWVYVKGHVRLENVILYEALPEKILARETGDRIRILIDNYVREETRRRAEAAARATQKTPPATKAKKAAGAGA